MDRGFSKYLTVTGGILMFIAFAVFYQLAWNKVIDMYWCNKIYSYTTFIGASLLNWGLFIKEENKRTKYLIYNTLSVFFFLLTLVYGIHDLVIHVFKAQNFSVILKDFNKLIVTIVLTSLSCMIYHFAWRK